MSDSNTEDHRTRRRAVRSVGPPPGEESAVDSANSTGAVAVSVRTPSPTSAAERASGSSGSKASRTAVTEASRVARTDADEQVSLGKSPATGAVEDTAATAVTEPGARDAESSGADTVVLDKDPEKDLDKDTAPEADKAAPKRSLGAARIALLAASVVLVLALLVGAGLSVLAMRSADQRDTRRAEYVQTARQAVVNLTTIRADSAKEDIDRILSVATGQFKTEFDGRVNPFTDIVKQVKIVSTGEVIEAGLESDDDNSARVLVAAKQTLTNAGEPQQQTRLYRFRVTVTTTDDGLKVSNVEFVA